jgi:hypothetical protein
MKVAAEALSGRVAGIAMSAPANGVVMSDAAANPTSIRVVGTPSVIGEKRTLYEVAPGDTVLLAEISPMRSDQVVVTGAGASISRSADTSKARRIQIRGATTMSTVPDTQSRKAFGAAAAPSRPPAAETLNGVTTLTWIDPASGSLVKLSGRHTTAELLEIKGRIEQLRAAEAAKKKP